MVGASSPESSPEAFLKRSSAFSHLCRSLIRVGSRLAPCYILKDNDFG